MRTFAFALLFSAMSLALTGAESKSVYGPETPGNSAFVRFVNATPGEPLSLELGATAYEPLKYGAVSAYKPVTPDIYQLYVSDDLDQEVIPKSGAYYTIACLPKAIVVFSDPPHVDPARVQLFLYNLSSLAKLDLKTADGKTAVIAAVASKASGMKIVNAVAVSLAVFNGQKKVGPVGDLGLERGSSFSVFVLGEGASPSVFAVKARVAVE